jgi:inorganic pyrophosphatase
MLGETGSYAFIVASSLVGLVYGVVLILELTRVPVGEGDGKYHNNDHHYLATMIGVKTELRINKAGEEYYEEMGNHYDNWDKVEEALKTISAAISDGAIAFLKQEYTIMAIFIALFAVIIAFAVDQNFLFLTTFAFVLGAVTSIISGYIGMKVAVYSNSRTAYSAINEHHGLARAFRVAFRGGAVLGFVLTSLALLNLAILIYFYEMLFLHSEGVNKEYLYECIAGYGLGGSTIALFGRVGGGIYTKAADVGADLAGKVEAGLDEDDPRNPATIADNVGDNVGDIAGMGSDLFGSFAESTCAALVIAATSHELSEDQGYMLFPLMISAIGIIVCIITSFAATHVMEVNAEEKIERTLKYQLIISTVILTPALYLASIFLLPESFNFRTVHDVKNWHIFVCLAFGLWSGLIVGFITEYYTSHSYTPVREVSEACKTGAATDIIYGLALGYLSCIVPTVCLALTIYFSFKLAGMYGIAMAALGMLSNLAIALAIDGYGPISDNAGGIVEMIHLKKDIRKKTDALDSAGNTTAAIGKGFAIGSAALVSLALFGAFITRVEMENVNILEPLVFAGLLVGAMLPYAFSAFTMKSVGKAANEMVEEVRRQFRLMNSDPHYKTEYGHCVEISTKAALKEMILPGCMVILTPILTGLLFGKEAVAGLLAGILVSGVQMATSMANSGGAWDNAKKFVEKEALVPKSSHLFKDIKAAAVTGDTVGDPMKDTSGPSLNILVKLSAILSLVFGTFFVRYGGLVFKLFNKDSESSGDNGHSDHHESSTNETATAL